MLRGAQPADGNQDARYDLKASGSRLIEKRYVILVSKPCFRHARSFAA